MEEQTVRQAMQQDMAQQRAAQQASNQTMQTSAAQQGTTHQKVPQGASQQKIAQQQATQAAQTTTQHAATHRSAQQARQRKAANQRAQQRARQKRAEKRRRSNIIKMLLCVILVLQLICAVQLFMVLQTANRIMDTLENGSRNAGTVQGNDIGGNGDADSNMVSGNAAGNGFQSVNSGSISGGATGNGNGTTQADSGENAAAKEPAIEDEDAWKLVLVNKWNEMEEGYVPELTEYAEGHRVDARIEDALRDMISGAKDAGYAIYLLSAYRDVEKQTDLYEAEVAKWRAAGYSQQEAKEKAGTIVAVPGTSEHHLGLAVDLVSSEHVKLDEGAEKTKGYKWLVAHCHEYGFILRYPNGATEITGIIYEPWHFRYVGVEAATEIMEAGITLEEYLEQ